MSPKGDPSTGDQEGQAGELPEAQLKQHQQAAAAARKQDRDQHEGKLKSELKGLEQVNAKYAARVEAAARKLGVDMQQIQAELASLLQQQDDPQFKDRMERFRATYDPLVEQVMAEAGIDAATIGDEVLKNVQAPSDARLLKPGRGQGRPDDTTPRGIGWMRD